ncbi:unnamed protein product [Linum tenue]|uniref:Uncharacterized protein n=1 Tax=Linum tenue TaxID=586396 RepID=A0AAV0RNL0_9ROSI|nr:unnamed protein product [Linum tenue]
MAASSFCIRITGSMCLPCRGFCHQHWRSAPVDIE